MTRQVQREGVHYVIKDPLTQEYFRFPEDEYQLIALFDGTRDLSRIHAQYSAEHPDTELSIPDVEQYLSTLDKMHLIEKPLAEQNLFLLEKQREIRKSKLLGVKGSLMYFRVSLLDPNHLLDLLYPKIRFVFSTPFLLTAVGCMLLSVFLIFQNYDQFVNGMASIFTLKEKTGGAIFGLWLTVVFVIFFHELGHAFTCKHFGGEVHEMGVLMLFFTPCFYANVNDAWMFEKRYQKLAVTFAGGFTEFFIGSLFTFIWVLLNPASPLSAISYQVLTICAVSSVMFNFNPLMKLDGYYAFSDFTSIPNLRAESGKYVKRIVQKYIFRLSVEDDCSQYTSREKKILLGYGICSTIYMTGLTIGLFFMARTFLLEKLGAIGSLLSLFVAWKLFKGHLMKFKGFVILFFKEKAVYIKAHPVLFTILFLVLGGIAFYSFKTHNLVLKKECEIQPLHRAKLYAGTSGYLSSHSIIPGTYVEKGQTIGKISNVDLEEKVVKLKIDKAIQEILKSNALLESNSDTRVSSILEIDRLNREIRSNQKELDKSAIVAPFSGSIFSSEADKGYQPFFTKGSEIGEIYSMDTFLIELKLPESEVAEINPGDSVYVRLHSALAYKTTGRIYSVSPTSIAYADSLKKAEGVETQFLVKILLVKGPICLLPSMTGIAYIQANKIKGFTLLRRAVRKGLRTDLFF